MLLGACGRWGFEARQADDARGAGDAAVADTHASGDAPGSDAPQLGPRCPNGGGANLFEGFDAAGPPCGAGIQTGSMMNLQRSLGLLEFIPTTANTGDAECTWDPFTLGTAVIVHVPKALDASQFDDTAITLLSRTSSAKAQFEVLGTTPPQLRVDDSVNLPVGTTPWSAQTTWLRLSATDTTHVAGAYSADGVTWTALGTIALSSGTTANVKLTLSATNGSALSSSNQTTVDAIYACP